MELFLVGVVTGLGIAVVLTELRRARANKSADRRIRERYQRGDV